MAPFNEEKAIPDKMVKSIFGKVNYEDPESNNFRIYDIPGDFQRSFGFTPRIVPFLSLKSDIDFLKQVYRTLFFKSIIDSTFDEFHEIFKRMLMEAIERTCANPKHKGIIYFEDFVFMYYQTNLKLKNKNILKPEDLFKIWNYKNEFAEVKIYCCTCMNNFSIEKVGK